MEFSKSAHGVSERWVGHTGESFPSFSDASFSGLLKEIQKSAHLPEDLSTFFSFLIKDI